MASKLTERWIIYGNILLIMFLFGLKFILAFSIGFIFYPIVLIYNLIRSQKSKRKVRLWTIIVVTTIVLWYAFIGIYAMIDAKSNAKVNNNTDANDAAMVQTIDIDSFSDQHALIEDLCEIACNATMEKETENTINFDWTITKPTQIHGVFFLEAKDSENPHYNILENLYLTNAIVVVSGYYLNEAGPISVNQWEMDIAVYPNFIVNENYSLVYDNESMYSHNLRSDDMDALMEWLSSEYADMNIQEIEYQ